MHSHYTNATVNPSHRPPFHQSTVWKWSSTSLVCISIKFFFVFTPSRKERLQQRNPSIYKSLLHLRLFLRSSTKVTSSFLCIFFLQTTLNKYKGNSQLPGLQKQAKGQCIFKLKCLLEATRAQLPYLPDRDPEDQLEGVMGRQTMVTQNTGY